MIYHITSKQDWNKAKREQRYKDNSLETVGFIHCSEKNQTATVAKELFDGRKDLVVLAVDITKLNSPVKHEPNSQNELFPHIYGPINLGAVVEVVSLREFLKR